MSKEIKKSCLYWEDLPFDNELNIQSNSKQEYSPVKRSNSTYDNQNHVRAVYKIESEKKYVKLWQENYERGFFFYDALTKGFYDEWKNALHIQPIIERNLGKRQGVVCRGYKMNSCNNLNNNNKSIREHFSDKLVDLSRRTKYFYYDINFNMSNVYSYNMQPCLIDLDSVYPLEEYLKRRGENPAKENGIYKEGKFSDGDHKGGNGFLVKYNYYRNDLETMAVLEGYFLENLKTIRLYDGLKG